MWRIQNQTSYAVERSWVRGRLGEEIWTVALKATFDIRPDGTTQLSSSQLPINTGPVLNSDNETLLYDTDFGPEKWLPTLFLMDMPGLLMENLPRQYL